MAWRKIIDGYPRFADERAVRVLALTEGARHENYKQVAVLAPRVLTDARDRHQWEAVVHWPDFFV